MADERTLTCPWWLLFTFDNPLRTPIHNPRRILSPYIREGMSVLDIGCGMGYFTLELARLAGKAGSVVAADLQPEMLAGLVKRATRAGLQDKIHPHICFSDGLGLHQSFDFVLAFWMVHEVRNRIGFLQEIYSALKPDGIVLVVEPLIHVSRNNFDRTIDLGIKTGFNEVTHPSVAFSQSVVFLK